MRRLPPGRAAAAWFVLPGLAACPPVLPVETPACPSVVVPIIEVDGASLSVEWPGCGSLDLQGAVLADGGEVTLSFEVDGGTVRPVLTAGGDAVFKAMLLDGVWSLDGDGDARWWRQGYQSWSWSGVVDLAGSIPTDALGLPAAAGDGDAFSLVDEDPATSWWGGLIGRSGGPSLLVGATEARVSKVTLGASQSRLMVVEGGRGTDIPLFADGVLSLEPLFFAMGSDPWAVHQAWADAVATAPGPGAEPPPVGWASWYVFYSDVTEADVRTNMEALAAVEVPEPGLVQIDDGWQRSWGDWQANERFPSGMAGLAADIRDAGFVPGLWMAPFYVSREAPAYLDNEDWWVRDADGIELRFSNGGSGDYAILDASHPEALEFLRHTTADRVAEGFGYLKLDFLYAGAQEGSRRLPVTGMEAYHMGMSALREGAGDAWVLACGAPLLPTVGYVESFRSGADIAFEIDPDPRVAYFRWQVRQTAARGWAHGRWWWNDADQLIVRSPLDDVEATGATVSVAVSGGTWLLGDDLPSLEPDRLDLAAPASLLHGVGSSWVPDAPLAVSSGFDPSPILERVEADDHPPVVWRSGARTALVNLEDRAVTVDRPAGVRTYGVGVVPEGPVTLAPGEGQVWE